MSAVSNNNAVDFRFFLSVIPAMARKGGGDVSLPLELCPRFGLASVVAAEKLSWAEAVWWWNTTDLAR